MFALEAVRIPPEALKEADAQPAQLQTEGHTYIMYMRTHTYTHSYAYMYMDRRLQNADIDVFILYVNVATNK